MNTRISHIASAALTLALLSALAGCGGGGGGDAKPATSADGATQPGGQPTPPTSGSDGGTPPVQDDCADDAAPAGATSTADVARVGPVDHLIVKLLPIASPTGSVRAMAASSESWRLQAVIDRVTSRAAYHSESVQARALAARTIAQGSIRVDRAVAGGAALLALGTTLSAADAETIAEAFAADPEVAFAEPDRRLFVRDAATTQDYSAQWHFFDASTGINLPAAWKLTTGSPSVVTAVLDTGYLPHPDLTANLLSGYNFITSPLTSNNGQGRSGDATDPGDWVTQQESADPNSPFRGCEVRQSTWHGTKVAGIIGAAAGNGAGIAGVSRFGKILPVRVLGKCGGATSDIAEAMRWAAGLPVQGVPVNPTPARVINLSLGGIGPCGEALQQAIDDVMAAGATVVVAAGNDGTVTQLDRPANCRGVIAVGATDSTGRRAWFSNFGASVTLSAPGANVYTTSNSGATFAQGSVYRADSGTSYAAPQVAGVASLMLAVNAKLTPVQIAQALKVTARRPSGAIAATCRAKPAGVGTLDAGAAVTAAANL
ncbi:TPA: S8 family peptidase [Burkholderia orbicola]